MKLGTINTLAATIIGVAFAATLPATAHHAFSTEFDAKQPITLKGTITRVEWINPHAWIHLDVKKDDELAMFRGLIAGADVFLHNLSPRAAKKLGIDAATLVAQHPSPSPPQSLRRPRRPPSRLLPLPPSLLRRLPPHRLPPPSLRLPLLPSPRPSIRRSLL